MDTCRPVHQAVIVFAHGSRDPAWSQPIERLADLIRQAQPGSAVACAYLELSPPDLITAVAALMSTHAQLRRLCILPAFLGMGRHARQDLPALCQTLQSEHPQLRIELLPAVGENDQVLQAMARSISASIGGQG